MLEDTFLNPSDSSNNLTTSYTGNADFNYTSQATIEESKNKSGVFSVLGVMLGFGIFNQGFSWGVSFLISVINILIVLGLVLLIYRIANPLA